ncbi:MAG: hypothetical protein FD133_1898 [Erysipelotrichaceae bacterium]|nr:MAG: hypothetical protein FD133_1898 [Erysipelotrichaceae bacterium]
MKYVNWFELIIGGALIIVVGFIFVSFIPTLTTNGSYELRFIFACTLFISLIIWFCFVRLEALFKELLKQNFK